MSFIRRALLVVVLQVLSVPGHAAPDAGSKAAEPLDAEAIFAGLNVYNPKSAELGYVVMSINAAYEEFKLNPNYQTPAGAKEPVRERYDQAMDKVRGVSYRDGYVDVLTKDTVELMGDAAALYSKTKLAGGAASSSVGGLEFKIPLNTINKLRSDAIDKLGTPGETPRMSTEVIQNAVAFGLRQAAGNGPMAEFYRRAVAQFFPQLNLDQKLDFEPGVMNKRILTAIQDQIGKSKSMGMLRTDDLERNQFEALEKLKSGLSQQLTEMRNLQAQEADKAQNQADREALIQKFESTRLEIQSGFGLATTLARISGQDDLAVNLDRAGQFSVAAFNVMNPAVSFASNPMTYLNGYATALNLGIALFSSGQSESAAMFKALGAIMTQLRGISEQIAAMEKQITSRLDSIDYTLKKYVYISTEKFRKFDTMQSWSESELLSLQSLVDRIHQTTTGTFLFESGRVALRLDSQCLNTDGTKDRMSARTFLDCRNQIANLAVGGMLPDLTVERNKSEVFDRVAKRLARVTGADVNDKDRRADPSAWLTGMGMLIRLGTEQPTYAPLLAEKSYSSVASFGAPQLIAAGRSMESTLSQMAVRNLGSGKFALRRDLINRLVTEYENSIKQTANYVRDLPNKMIRGISRPNVPVAKQTIVDRPEAYPAFAGGFGLCKTDSDVRFENGRTGQPWPEVFFSKASVVDRMNKFADQVKWSPNFNRFLPESVRRALSTGFVDGEHGELKLSGCFTQVLNITCDDCGHSSNFLTLVIHANYNVGGLKKSVEVAVFKGELVSQDQYPFINFEAHLSPLSSVWNGQPPFMSQHALSTNMAQWHALPGKDLAQFEGDFQKVLDVVNEKVIDDLQGDNLTAFNDESRAARATLAFVLERGLQNDQPAVSALLNWISDSRNLPEASYWADAQYRLGLDTDAVAQALTRRLEPFRKLLDEVERSSSLKPRTNVFGARITEFTSLLNVAPAP